MTQRQITRITPSLEALKALTHPDRMRMLGILRREGPQTATSLAARLGLNTGASSYHLRQLAGAGFIAEDNTRGNRRERWWTALHETTVVSDADMPDHGGAEAQGAFRAIVATGQAMELERALAAHDALPEDWKRASTLSDATIHLTPAQAEALMAQMLDLLRQAQASAPPVSGLGPDGTRRFTVQLRGFPFPQPDAAP